MEFSEHSLNVIDSFKNNESLLKCWRFLFALHQLKDRLELIGEFACLNERMKKLEVNAVREPADCKG